MIKKNKKIEVEDLQGEGVIQLGEVLALHLVQGEPDLARAVFFFKQKTAYEVSVSDWSSDVCSSDLAGWPLRGHLVLLNANLDDKLPLRRWPPERFVEVGRRLLAERPDVIVGLTGVASE